MWLLTDSKIASTTSNKKQVRAEHRAWRFFQAAHQTAELLTDSAASLCLPFPGTANAGAICESMASSPSQTINGKPELPNVTMETEKKKNKISNSEVSCVSKNRFLVLSGHIFVMLYFRWLTGLWQKFGWKNEKEKLLKCSLTVIPLNKYFYCGQASNAKCHFLSSCWGLSNLFLLRKLMWFPQFPRELMRFTLARTTRT